jgi:hypothetical protein
VAHGRACVAVGPRHSRLHLLGRGVRLIEAGRWTSASNHVALVVSAAVTPSPMLRQASSNWPSSAYALAKYDECNGIHNVVPVDRNAAMPEVILWTASEALRVNAKRQPCIGVQSAFQVKEPFSRSESAQDGLGTLGRLHFYLPRRRLPRCDVVTAIPQTGQRDRR